MASLLDAPLVPGFQTFTIKLDARVYLNNLLTNDHSINPFMSEVLPNGDSNTPRVFTMARRETLLDGWDDFNGMPK